MKHAILCCFVFFGLNLVTKAQNENPPNHLGVGMQLGQFQNDFGLGLNITSPYFLHHRVAFRAKGNFVWNEHLNTVGETTWTSYANASIGIVGIAGEIGNFARVYGEGGFLLLTPSKDFSSSGSEHGGYGLLGFEFLTGGRSYFFMEIGAVGTGAKADVVVGKPIYSNGLLIQTGCRFQF